MAPASDAATAARRPPAPLPPGAFRVPVQIRFSHCDPAGIVYFPRYFDMFNGVVEDWFTRRLGIDYADMIRHGRQGLPTVHAECDYYRPSRMGETLTMGVAVERIGRSSIQIRIVGERDGEIRLQGRLVLVVTSLDSDGPLPIPASLRNALSAYENSCHE